MSIRPIIQSTYETSTSIEPQILQGDVCRSSLPISEFYGRCFFKKPRHEDYPLHVTTQLLKAMVRGELTFISQETLDDFLRKDAQETHYDAPPQITSMIKEHPLHPIGGPSSTTFNFAWSFHSYHPKLAPRLEGMESKEARVFLMYIPKGDVMNPPFEDCEQYNAGIFKEDATTYYVIYTNYGNVEIKKFNSEDLNRDLCDRFHNGDGIPITKGVFHKMYISLREEV